jgi:hypothetical protein
MIPGEDAMRADVGRWARPIRKLGRQADPGRESITRGLPPWLADARLCSTVGIRIDSLALSSSRSKTSNNLVEPSENGTHTPP